MAFLGLHAGSPTEISKNSDLQKEMELSVTQNDSQKNKNKVTLTVTFKGDKHTRVRLISDGKNNELKIAKKDNKMVSMSFEIEKSNLDKSSLLISNADPSNSGYAQEKCPPLLSLRLSEYTGE